MSPKPFFRVDTLLILSSTCIVFAFAYSGGAPEAVCEDMTPKHPAPPQASRFPYTISIDKKELRGSKDKLQITVGGHKPFKGFLLQVRDGDKAIGQFEVSETDKFVKTINCFGNKGSAATHKNSAEKKSLTLTWRPPANLKANVKVFATIAQDGGTYWVRKPTQTVKLI